MVGYDSQNNALTLGDDDSLKVGEYELQYDSTSDEFQAEYGRPIGGELGNHGEIIGPIYTQDSHVGNNAIRFLGGRNSGHRVSTINDGTFNFGSGEFAISFWVNFDDSTEGTLFEAYESDNTLYRVFNNDLGSSGWSWDTSGNTTNNISYSFPTGTEEHYVFQRNSSDEIELYVNGSFEETVTTDSSNLNIGGEFHLGYDDKGGTEWGLLGSMDEVKVYNSSLSSSDITTLSDKGEVTTNLVAHYGFEYPETPNVAIDSTGEAFPKNSIPRSTSGSLVPQGFADVLSQGEVLADNGEIYTSVQTAVDNSSGFVFVGPGIFNESVTISTQGLTLQGSGYDTIIDGGSVGNGISINAKNVTVKNVSLQSSNNHGIKTNSQSSVIDSVVVRSAPGNAVRLSGAGNHTVINCDLTSTADAINFTGSGRTIVKNCKITTSGQAGLGIHLRTGSSDSSIISSCLIQDTKNIGIRVVGNDIIITGCRVINSEGDGISVAGKDNIIANSRVSGSANLDIEDNGTGTVLDDNLTGPSN